MVTEQIHSMYENNKSVTRIYRMRHKLTGESIWIEDNPQLLYDDEGNIIGLFGTARDITKRKNTELALQDSEALYHSLVENIPASIFRKDYAGRYVFVNSRFCQLKGMSKDEILGKTPLELASYELTKVLVPGLSSEMSTKQRTITQGAEHHELIVRTGQQIEIEEIYSQPDGTSQHFQVIKSPIFNFDGIIIGTQGIQFNITEKKKLIDDLIAAKEKAEQMTRLKSNFLANMSHELRTPLVGILGFSEILTSELDDPKHLNLVNDIYKSGKRLSDTLNLILNLSKAESGNIELNANIFNADTITKQRVNLFRPAAAVKNLSMELIVKDDNVFTKLDEHLFASVLDNLINNAVKFTNDGTITVEIGKVIVSAKPWFYVKVKDTGIGISEDNLNIIFDEFRQVSEGYGRSFEGTGLGLTITKKITELMGGVISVESEFDVGSVFTVKFPALENILQEETAYDSA
jgi:PAS domain S-box-containing protein